MGKIMAVNPRITATLKVLEPTMFPHDDLTASRERRSQGDGQFRIAGSERHHGEPDDEGSESQAQSEDRSSPHQEFGSRQ